MLHGDDEQSLRRRALAALHAQVLPRAQPARTWGGNGSGEPCGVCGRSIDPDQKGLELEFVASSGGGGASALHMHIPCFAAWKSAKESAENGLSPADRPDRASR